MTANKIKKLTRPLAIIKFGSSILTKTTDFPKAVHQLYYYLRKGYQIVVVVSAIGNTTDQLLGQAEEVLGHSVASYNTSALATLLATGEIAAAALFALALQRIGIFAGLIDRPVIISSGDSLDATPIACEVDKIFNALAKHDVVVLPGFIAFNKNGEINLLGRGGSDLSAMVLAAELPTSECILVKDVDGVYDCDPNINCNSRPFQTLTFADAMNCSKKVIQTKALQWARTKQIPFKICSIGEIISTLVGAQRTQLRQIPPQKPLRVGLLGLGTVGYGVYLSLQALPELFQIIGIAVRNTDKHRDKKIAARLITTNPWIIINSGCDIVVELIGGIVPAYQLTCSALRNNCHVVTANKAVIAQYGDNLTQFAKLYGVQLNYSAAVAGGIPVLELISKLSVNKPIRKVSGVLNGTCNYILNQLLAGTEFTMAVKNAQLAGYAEADPTLDLNGTDAAQKISIIAKLVFGHSPNVLNVQGIEGINSETINLASKNQQKIRLVASCEMQNNSIIAAVSPQIVSNKHPFANLAGVENCVVIEFIAGDSICLRGYGAGRWPTTEAVIGDLLDIARHHGKTKEKSSPVLIKQSQEVVL